MVGYIALAQAGDPFPRLRKFFQCFFIGRQRRPRGEFACARAKPPWQHKTPFTVGDRKRLAQSDIV
jgi:hypothetical protein